MRFDYESIQSFLFLTFMSLVPKISGDLILTEASPIDLVNEIMVGDAQVTGPTLQGHPECNRIFKGGVSTIPGLDPPFPDEGIILSSGNATHIIDQTGVATTSWESAHPGDPDITEIVGQTTHDACVLEFDFVCSETEDVPFSFDYVFGSDEYPDWVNTNYNDGFGFFLNGENLAVVPGTNSAVSVNTINENENLGYYVDNPSSLLNDGPYPKFEANGFTKTLKAIGTAIAGSNHIKLAIADAFDGILDSWVLIKGTSFTCTDDPSDVPSDQPSKLPSSSPTPNPTDVSSDQPSSNPSYVPSDQPSHYQAFEKKICTVWPDPHFKPFSYTTEYFDFHYGCDVIFLKNNNVEIHLRLDERGNDPDKPMSLVRSVGVKIGNDILQVTSNNFQFYINDPQRNNGNDISTNPLPNNSKIGSWELFTYNSKPYLKSDWRLSPSIEIRNPSNTAKIVIQENPHIKSLLVQVSGEGNIFKSEFDETVGMCSHIDSDDSHFYDRDNVLMVPQPGRHQPSFGEEWQVTDNDTQILSDPVLDFGDSYHAHAKFPKQCSSSTGRRNLRDNIFDSSTTSSCTFCQNLWNPVVVETCEFDASVLGCEAMNEYVYSPVFSNFFPGPQPVFGTDFSCINNADFFFNDEKETCQWIRFKESRRSEFCQYQTVRVNCPLSCGLCCEDDASYKFTAKFGKKGRTKDCEWLGKKKKRREKWCNEKDDGDELNEWQNGKMIRDACPKSCNFCADLVEVIG